MPLYSLKCQPSPLPNPQGVQAPCGLGEETADISDYAFVMDFLKDIFSIRHSIQSTCQSDRVKNFGRSFQAVDQWRLRHAAILLVPATHKTQINIYEPHLGNEKPVQGNIIQLLK